MVLMRNACDPFRIIGMAKTSFIGIRIDAGVVDEQVYGFIGQHLRQALDLRMIGDIKRMNFYQLGILRRQFVERIRFFRMAAASQNTPAVCGILPAKLQSDSAVGTRDQCGFHCYPRLGFH